MKLLKIAALLFSLWCIVSACEYGKEIPVQYSERLPARIVAIDTNRVDGEIVGLVFTWEFIKDHFRITTEEPVSAQEKLGSIARLPRKR